jgi:hypothetical protein
MCLLTLVKMNTVTGDFYPEIFCDHIYKNKQSKQTICCFVLDFEILFCFETATSSKSPTALAEALARVFQAWRPSCLQAGEFLKAEPATAALSG